MRFSIDIYKIMTNHIIANLHSTNFPIPKNDEYSIAIYFASHDASITIAKGREVLEVMELERFTNFKNINIGGIYLLGKYTKTRDFVQKDKFEALMSFITDYIKKKYTPVFDYGIIVDQDFRTISGTHTLIDFKSYFNVKTWLNVSHHVAHAYGAFYQSSYQQALVVTFDGGSPDGNLNCFLFDRNMPKPVHLFSDYHLISTEPKIKPFDYGTRYSKYGNVLGDIRFTNYEGFLTYPGKIMGLAAYGKVNSKLKFYLKQDLRLRINSNELSKVLKVNPTVLDKTFNANTAQKLAISSLRDSDRISGQAGFDLAATLQEAFEEVVIEDVFSLVKKYKNLPLCYSGGCALNIILNTRLFHEWNNEIFVPPNPNDAGLTHGAMLALTRPKKPNTSAYLGPKLFDLDMLPYYLFEEIGFHDRDFLIQPVDVKQIAALIAEGKIIGIARGRAEIGPRALGNRSIVCSVAIDNMKDIINAKVKNREWFRPFAPVVRLENVNKYFHWDRESPYMSFCPKVREEYIDKIKPVVHIDNTARVQTITREQNEFLYDLLGEVEKTTGYDILLNTSFNVDSSPILNSVKDAIQVLKNTRLDGIIIEDTLIMKKQNGDQDGNDSMRG